MSSYKLIPRAGLEENVSKAIHRVFFEKNSVNNDTRRLRYPTLSIIVKESSIGHPITTKKIYELLRNEPEYNGRLETLVDITPTISVLYGGMKPYIGRTPVYYGQGKGRRCNVGYFLRIDKVSETDAENIQKIFLGVLDKTKEEFELFFKQEH